MTELNTKEKLSIEDYNSIPIVYCKNCLSLKIMILDDRTDYCDNCGCTNVEHASIEDWEKLYKKKYGKSYLIK